MTVSAQIKKLCEQTIEQLMKDVKGARAAVISTEDGFEIASVVENTAQVSRLAAMASSMAALGAIAGEESGLGASSNIIIQAHEGVIIVSLAKRTDVDLILSVVASKDVVMGQLLYAARAATSQLRKE